MMVGAINFELSASPEVALRLASSEGLSPLPLPEAILRFQSAMRDDGEAARMDYDVRRVVLADGPAMMAEPAMMTEEVKAELVALSGFGGIGIENDVPEKGVAENDVYKNDVSKNGISENDVCEKGVAENDVPEKGVAENDVCEKGVAENDVPEKGIAENDIFKNGIAENDISKKGIAENDVYEKGEADEKGVELNPGNPAITVGETTKPGGFSRIFVRHETHDTPAVPPTLSAAPMPQSDVEPVIASAPAVERTVVAEKLVVTKNPVASVEGGRTAVPELEKIYARVEPRDVPEATVVRPLRDTADGIAVVSQQPQSAERGDVRVEPDMPVLVQASAVDSAEETVPLQKGVTPVLVSAPVAEKSVAAEAPIVEERPPTEVFETSKVAMPEQPVTTKVDVGTGATVLPVAEGPAIKSVVVGTSGIDKVNAEGSLESPATPVRETAEFKEVLHTFTRRETHELPEAPTVLPAMPMPRAVAPGEIISAPQASVAQTARTEAIAEAVVKTVEIVNQVVEAVVERIVATPTLAQGEGEIRITLKPTILDGSEIRLSAKAGELVVSIAPATGESAQIVQQNLQRLESALAMHALSFHHVAVVIATTKKGKMDETA